MQNRARMLVSCPDRPGIVAAVSHFLFEQGANIVHSDRHTTDPEGGTAFEPIARRFDMDWRVAYAARTKRIALFASKEDHCLLELLWQWKAGEIRANIAMVVANHPDLKPLVG